MPIQIRRRELISLIGGAAWPLAARAQQPAPPLIGFLSSLASSDLNLVVPAFREGLNGTGFVEGRNIAIEYRWAEGDYQRLPTLSADLVRRKVAVIAAISGTPAALAAKAATATIPIVFAMASDPVDAGVVSSLNRPGDNITGATFFTALLGEKRMELLREFVPKATTIALLVNPDNRAGVVDGTNAQAAAHAMGLRAMIFDARASREIDAAFATLPPGTIFRLVTDYQGVKDAFADRVEDLGVSLVEIDAVSGLTRYHMQKLISNSNAK